MTTPNEPVAILTTGGTIDKLYSLAGDLVTGPPAAGDILEHIVTAEQFRILPVLEKDSLDMTAEDRDLVAEAVAGAGQDRIVITHGTDTMAETAERIARDVAPEKVVVITGAMQPAVMRHTDAQFNLGFAIASAKLAVPGVYVAMSARLFRAGEVSKDRATGLFMPVA